MVPTMMFLVEISVCYDTPKHSEKHKRNHQNKKAHTTILVVSGVIKFIKICFHKKQHSENYCNFIQDCHSQTIYKMKSSYKLC